MIPVSALFDQTQMAHLLPHDPVVSSYRSFFSLIDWELVAQWEANRSSRGRPPSS